MLLNTRHMQITSWSLATLGGACPAEQGLSFAHHGTISPLSSEKRESGNPEVGL